ncbi:MAG: ABC transporter permease [Rectinemataceae bacterium]|jgi:ABC-type lipoprotein release transport system permease subunit
MLKLVFEYVLHGFRSTWKLYMTNILSLMAILLLFAYLDGARRQLDLRNSVFSGEVVVRMKVELPEVESTLKRGLPGIVALSKKIRAPVTYKAPGKSVVGEAELLGAELGPRAAAAGGDAPLASWLNIISGRMLENDQEMLVPESLLEDANIKVGDAVSVQGRTSGNELNSAMFRVCGIYRSSELGLFAAPRLIVSYESMRSFFIPGPQDIEYCLFFRGASPPESVNALVSRAFHDPGKLKVRSVESGKVSVFDVLNISVQFNVFLVIVVFVAIFVMATVIVLVNFNIFTIVFHKRQKEIGTLMAFGSPAGAIALALILESLAQVLICTAVAASACLAISLAASRFRMGGSFELLLTLLSGTDRLDLHVTFAHVRSCFLIMASAMAIAQAPVALRVLAGSPAAFLGAKR